MPHCSQFIQASNQGVASFVHYLYAAEKKGGLGLDVDYDCAPFAAVPEKGHGTDDLGGFSELAHAGGFLHLGFLATVQPAEGRYEVSFPG